MREGPLHYQSAYELLEARGYRPVPGSSRFENERGETGRIVEAPGRGDTWYVEMEGAADRTQRPNQSERLVGREALRRSDFREGYTTGEQDRLAGREKQLCDSAHGGRPPVTKREDGSAYYHGYKAATQTLASEPSAYVAYQVKHRRESGMARNIGGYGEAHVKSWMRDHVGEYVDMKTGEVNATKLAEEAAYESSRSEWLDDSTHPIWDWALDAAARYERGHRRNPAHLSVSGNFDIGIGSKDDPEMRRNSAASLDSKKIHDALRYVHGASSRENRQRISITAATDAAIGYFNLNEAEAQVLMRAVHDPRAAQHVPNAKVDRRAYDFFKKHAGMVASLDNTDYAEKLALAEAEAEERGWTVEWEHDIEPDVSWMDEEQTEDYQGGRMEMLVALLKDENGTVLASLGGIAMDARGVGRNPYGRVVEAELALEALSEEGR